MAMMVPIMAVAGSLLSAKGARDAGKAQQKQYKFQAKQLEQQAGQTLAASQRDAMEQRREAGLIGSRALALAAASGGGASDPSIMKLLSDIKGEGAYRASVALYQGEDKAQQLRLNADSARYSGALANRAGKQKMVSHLLQAGSTMFSRFGQGGPSQDMWGGEPNNFVSMSSQNSNLDPYFKFNG